MLIGKLVVALGLASQHELDRALDEQRKTGRKLQDIMAGGVGSAELERVLRSLPASPRTVEELGINRSMAKDMFLKTAALSLSYSTASLADELCIPSRVAGQLIEEARQQKLISLRPGLTASDLHFSLSAEGKSQADAAFEGSSYVGPLPVSLDAYVSRVRLQSIRAEAVPPAVVTEVFADLVTTAERLRDIGAAANSSKSALLFGPPGNGKTSIAERMGKLFRSFIFIPHCIEVGGQVIRVFDASVHRKVQDEPEAIAASRSQVTIVEDDYDRRWVPCTRPFVFAGGELTQAMLDLNFNAISKYYEAPLQVKANNGVFLIDDFGRQLVPPRALLNRWIVPMDRGVDYLKLHTGKSFSVPFDALLLFSTNLSPEELMDPTFLRRMPHKIFVDAPTEEDFRAIFARVLAEADLGLDGSLVDRVVARIRDAGVPLAAFQPIFIVDQVRDLRRYLGRDAVPDDAAVEFALKNLLSGQSGEARTWHGLARQ